nr:MAG TPA: hypothetical protein [Caudoviricetes sp.]
MIWKIRSKIAKIIIRWSSLKDLWTLLISSSTIISFFVIISAAMTVGTREWYDDTYLFTIQGEDTYSPEKILVSSRNFPEPIVYAPDHSETKSNVNEYFFEDGEVFFKEITKLLYDIERGHYRTSDLKHPCIYVTKVRSLLYDVLDKYKYYRWYPKVYPAFARLIDRLEEVIHEGVIKEQYIVYDDGYYSDEYIFSDVEDNFMLHTVFGDGHSASSIATLDDSFTIVLSQQGHLTIRDLGTGEVIVDLGIPNGELELFLKDMLEALEKISFMIRTGII